MYLHRDEFKRSTRAPAKLNLLLEVVGRRENGFHDLETIIVPIQLGDWLSLTATPLGDDGQPGEISVAVKACRWLDTPPHAGYEIIPVGDENLIVRALKLLRRQSHCQFGAHVELVKRIPLAAGMGGGSSDAAAALRLANRVWRLNWQEDRLLELAAELGSDVPFFLSPGAAICRGRGEQVERLPAMQTLHFVVVKPHVSLSTSDVYRAHDALSDSAIEHATLGAEATQITSPQLGTGRWGDLRRWMHNRLQAAAATLTPWVRQASSMFDTLDFVAHQLSGSGSAYFGVCRHAQHAQRMAAILRRRQLGLVYATRSCQ
jgi:4-diphosphocytidyl-2-C-methyl-D-erythritol kinase